MPEASASLWKPKVEKRLHPFGEEGVRSSLEEVAKKAAQGYLDPRVRAWAIETLQRARQEDGKKVDNPRARAEVLLAAVQKKLWVPDAIGSEWIAGSHLTACVDKDAPCFHGGDCDDLSVLLASSLASVGIYTMIVGQSYNSSKSIGHVLCAAHIDGKWLYADPSTDYPLGKCVTPFTRERWLSFPEIKVVCDASDCRSSHARMNPENAGFVKQGTFVGVDGPFAGRVEWLGDDIDLTGPECRNYPNGLSEETVTEYATRCGKEAAAKWIEAETGVAIGACAQEDDGGQMAECVANNYGITLDVYEDGEIKWDAVSQDAGAVGGIVVCVASGVGAAGLPLCGQIGGKLGQYAYVMAEGFVEFADGFGKMLGLWGDDEYLVACDARPIESLPVTVAIGKFMQNGASFLPKSAKLPGPLLSADTVNDNKAYWGRMLSMRGLAILSAQVAAQIAREAGVSPQIAVRALNANAPARWDELVRVNINGPYPSQTPTAPERYVMSLGAFMSSLEPGWGTSVIVPSWKKPQFWSGVSTTSVQNAAQAVASASKPTPDHWQYFATYTLPTGPPCPNNVSAWGTIKGSPSAELAKLPALTLTAGHPPSDVPISVRAFKMPSNLHRLAQELGDSEFKKMLLAWRVSVTTGIDEKIEVARRMRPAASRRSGLAPVLGIAAAGAAAWWVSTII